MSPVALNAIARVRLRRSEENTLEREFQTSSADHVVRTRPPPGGQGRAQRMRSPEALRVAKLNLCNTSD